MSRALRVAVLSALAVFLFSPFATAQDPPKPAEPDPAKTPAMKADVDAVATDVKDVKSTGIHKYADISWVLIATALVMLMMPGLALFYGGMTRRKNVLGTMMHTMIALGLVGVQWVVVGYALAFGDPLVSLSISSDDKGEPIKAGVVGFSPELVGLGTTAAIGVTEADVYKEKGIDEAKATEDQKKQVKEEAAKRSRFKNFPNTNIPVYLHAMFQGMFAIITIALVSGAFAERVKFGAYCLFALLWTTLVYDPLAHMVWSLQWTWLDSQKVNGVSPAAGLLGANGAIDFAGGTVVHIAAGMSGLASILILRKRIGYGKQTFHPNSMVMTLLGAGLLWFGWFGFNGGSALFANGQAVSALTVTQIAAATAGLAWVVVEWLHRGKPTALGFASGLVAGLVAITPASGFVAPTGALIIGIAAGVVCYWAVAAKSLLGYDDSLDAFGIHGVGGFLGAVLTGALCSLPLWVYGSELNPNQFPGKFDEDPTTKVVTFNMLAQIKWQVIAALISTVYAFVMTGVLVFLIDKTIGFTVTPRDEGAGLDLSQHGEVGVDVGPDVDAGAVVEPKAAAAPPANGHGRRFTVVVEGADPVRLMTAWSELCQAKGEPPSREFAAVYPYVTTVSGNKFRFRGGDPVLLKDHLKRLFEDALKGTPVKTHVEA